MSIDPKKQRAVDTLHLAVFADRLTDGQHMPLVEAQIKRAATVPGSAEGDTLGADRRIRLAGVVGADQQRHIDQHFR